MDRLQRQVREFHKVINMPTSPAEPMLRLMELRAAICAEEAIELVMALVGTARGQTVVVAQLTEVLQKMARAGHDGQPNLEEAIDACADSLVVTYGTLECIGVDGEPFTDEVMRANMTKQGGPVRSDGKQEKPPGWKPPDITGVLEKMLKERQPDLMHEATTASVNSQLKRSIEWLFNPSRFDLSQWTTEELTTIACKNISGVSPNAVKLAVEEYLADKRK